MGNNIKSTYILIAGMHVAVEVRKYEAISNDEYDALFSTPTHLNQLLAVQEADGVSRKVFVNGGLVRSNGGFQTFNSLQADVETTLGKTTLELAVECKSVYDFFSRFKNDDLALENLIRTCIDTFENEHPGNLIDNVTIIPMIPQRILRAELARHATDLVAQPELPRIENVHEVQGHTAQIHIASGGSKIPVSRSNARKKRRNSWAPLKTAITGIAASAVLIVALTTNEKAPADETKAPISKPISDPNSLSDFTTSSTITIAPTTIVDATTVAPLSEVPVTQAPVTEAPVTQAPVTQAPITAPPTTIAHLSAKQPANGRAIDSAQCSALASDPANTAANRQAVLCGEFVKYKGGVDEAGNGKVFYSHDVGNHCVEAIVAVRGNTLEVPGTFSNNGNTGKTVACR